MPQPAAPQTPANPAPQGREPSTPSFRETAVARLQAERGAEPPPTPPTRRPAPPQQEAEHADDPSFQEDEQGVRQSAEEGDFDPEALQDPADDAGDDQAPEEGSAEYWRLKAAESEDSRTAMERDYRRKTHKIAESHRAAEDQHQSVLGQAQFFVGLAEQGLRQFEGVNWQALTAQPEQYEQMRRNFMAAQQFHQNVTNALGSVQKSITERRETSKKREAEISREILKSTVPGWNNQLYSDLRAFAVEELDYTPQEVDDMTDWRRIRDIHSQWQVRKAKDVLKNPPKRRNQPEKRGGGNAPLPNSRNERGQFQSALTNLQRNPGSKQAGVGYFQAKLRAERRQQSSE